MTRVLFGGSFDPLHLGHLAIADAVQKQWQPEQFLWLPASQSPHKLDDIPAPNALRQTMLEQVVNLREGEEVCLLELQRPGPSFTIDTLRSLDWQGSVQKSFLVIGGDSLAGLAEWKDVAEICNRIEWLIAPRPGWPPGSEEVFLAAVQGETRTHFHCHWLSMEKVPLASQEIRQQIGQGKSCAEDLPDPVFEIIQKHRLYQS